VLQQQAEQLSDEQIELELLKLEKHLEYEDEREDFKSYCQNSDLFPEESPAKHHAFMCEALQLVEQGEIKRLMVLMPPGHGKSVYCSVRFPSWYLGRHPKHHLIHATYGGDLASVNGRKVRNLLLSPDYAEVFRNVTVAEDFKGTSVPFVGRTVPNHGGLGHLGARVSRVTLPAGRQHRAVYRPPTQTCSAVHSSPTVNSS
jgi:hypothetical protein